MPNAITVNAVRVGTVEMNAVMRLGRQYSATLGFFPEGAFEEHAAKDSLLAATTGNGNVLGYILYRVTSRHQAAIVHLCVDEAGRGKGVARTLFRALIGRLLNCTDILVTCRRDFDAHGLWPKLGFTAVGEKRGRAKVDTVLTTFRYVTSQLPLLAWMSSEQLSQAGQNSKRVCVVIDANVFFDLDTENPGNQESQSLASDWLTDFVELSVTDELLNEIARSNDATRRTNQRARLKLFNMLETVGQLDEGLVSKVMATIDARPARPSSESDAKHVAKTIAASAGFFVTRDAAILAAADRIYEEFALRILAPHEIILRFDELRREAEYRPRYLFVGPGSSMRRADADSFNAIQSLVPNDTHRKRRLARIRELLGAPDSITVTCVNVRGVLQAVFATARGSATSLEVPILLVRSGPLADTIARHLAHAFIVMATDESRMTVVVTPFDGNASAGLRHMSYFSNDDRFVRAAHRTIGSLEQVRTWLGDMECKHRELSGWLSHVETQLGDASDRKSAMEMTEKLLWPVKVRGANIPCFIVPIQAKWAAGLFDEKLASQTLFGAQPRLALNVENAYYRSPRPRILEAGGRILWYISGDKRYGGSGAIRACSYLDDIVVGTAKTVYQRYRHLGVYDWDNVFEVAQRDPTKPIQGFRFTRTEILMSPVPFKEIQSILFAHERGKQQFQSPLRIDENVFFSLYSRATGQTNAS